ncbi:endonuclease/exonuclease/phosphatase family protein [Agrococcus sp. SCSIO52902]|uniref:endonuclease/exonuclease/phosphatase family protein n=1 Tax=Agrococcus sp. SCSIO52902 TaxID=2933290 RepID=UPI001FF19FFF|nr:endonuclease/exonuclease/phosphatase family protein [Agrococcus sp. SCSIO52902]UOW01528.1 endonuclease/exonuclease/phosphatase family protein [Agrococcus sp. SCSIO52902]
MRLATWNILHGRTHADPAVDEDRFRRAIADLDADVLALQEVDRGQSRSGHIDLTAVAAEAMGAAASRFVPTVIGDPARPWRPAGDDDLDATADAYGIALLSRYPVLRWHVHRLPPAPMFRAPVVDPETHRVVWLRDEPRAIVAATIRTPHGVWTIASAHLTFVQGTNAQQLRHGMRWLRTLPGPRVLMGDLNLPPGMARRVARARLLARGATYPSHRPLVQLDHVLSADQLPPSRQARAPRPAFSDHLPVVVDF